MCIFFILLLFSIPAFAGPSLSEADAIRLALARDPQAQANDASLRADLARLAWLEGLLRERPELEGDWQRDTGTGGNRLGLLLELPLYAPGEQRASRRLAMTQRDASSARAQSRQLETAYQTRLAYRQASLAQEETRLAEQSLALAKDLLALSQRRLQAGQIARIDHQSILLEANQAEDTLLARRQQEAERRIRLGQWVGEAAHDGELGAAFSEPAPAEVSDSPVLALARQELASKQAERDLKQKQGWSGLRLGLATQIEDGRDGANSSLSLRLRAPLPLDKWQQSQLRSAEAGAVQAQAALDLAVREVEARALQLTQAQAVLKTRLALTDQRIQTAEDNVRLAQQGFSAGVLDAETALRAKNRLSQAHSERLQIRQSLLENQNEYLWLLGVKP